MSNLFRRGLPLLFLLAATALLIFFLTRPGPDAPVEEPDETEQEEVTDADIAGGADGTRADETDTNLSDASAGLDNEADTDSIAEDAAPAETDETQTVTTDEDGANTEIDTAGDVSTETEVPDRTVPDRAVPERTLPESIRPLVPAIPPVSREEREAAERAAQEAARAEAERQAQADLAAAAAEEPTVTMTLPVLIEGRRAPGVMAQATVKELKAVSPSGLSNSLGDAINDEMRQSLEAMGDEMVSIERIEQMTGLDLYLDPATLSVAAQLPDGLQKNQQFAGADRFRDPNVPLVPAANFAFGLSTVFSANDTLDDQFDPLYGLELNGFTNFGGIDGINVDFSGSYIYDPNTEESDFRRGRIIAFKDDIERAIRYSFGDLLSAPLQLAGDFDFLGFSVERNFSQLQPRRNVRSLGRSSLTIERPSIIEVYSNGILVNTFSADPGVVTLNDIPLTEITNNVVVVVEDSFGRREVDNFSVATDINLLEPGLNQFSISGGVRRDDADLSDIAYTEDPVVTGTYMQGITNNLTLGANATYSEEISQLGASLVTAALNGIILLDSSFSFSDEFGTGYAGSIDYRAGPFNRFLENDFLSVQFDYFSEDYTTLSSFDFVSDTEFNTNASYNFDAFLDTNISLGTSYS